MITLRNLFYISIAGAIGAALRFMVIKVIIYFYDKKSTLLPYPHHTFFVNMAACFFIGYFSMYLPQNQTAQTYIKMLTMGVLAAFSTFSTYITDVCEHFRTQKALRATAYLISTIILGIGFELLGRAAAGDIHG